MYKVFINERKLSFTNAIQQIDKNLEFVDVNTFSIAIDLLENTSAPSVNIYAENVEEVWNTFSALIQKYRSCRWCCTEYKR